MPTPAKGRDIYDGLSYFCFITRGWILGRSWDNSLKSFPPCYSQLPLLTDFTPLPTSPPHLRKSGLKLVCNVNIVHGNLNSVDSQDYAQKPQQICMFMNTASGQKNTCYRTESKQYVVERKRCFLANNIHRVKKGLVIFLILVPWPESRSFSQHVWRAKRRACQNSLFKL
jgi:hypothetical protein